MERKKRGLSSNKLMFFILLFIFLWIYLGYLFFNYIKNDEINTPSPIVQNPMDSIKSNYLSSNVSSSQNNGDVSFSNITLQDYNETEVVQEGVREFNESYIDYILLGLGVDNLHSAIGFGNPIIITVVSGEEWNSEIVNGVLSTTGGLDSNGDIKVILSKEEAVKAILAEDIKIFMKNSVANGNTKIEMVAGNTELFGKGYLGLYNDLTGNVVLKVNSQW